MASFAAHTLIHMNAVVEINVIRQVVHARPANRRTTAKTLAHRLQHRGSAPDLRVAVHARLGWRDVGRAVSLNRGVAVAAIDSVVRHMMHVAEQDGLLAHFALARLIARPVERGEAPGEKRQGEDRTVNRDARKSIRAVMKDLSHSSDQPIMPRVMLRAPGRGAGFTPFVRKDTHWSPDGWRRCRR